MTSNVGSAKGKKRKYPVVEIDVSDKTKRNRSHLPYNDKTYSDITIKFGDRKIFAHKVILARESVYFHRAFQSGFSIATSDVVDLGDDENPNLVEIMIQFIYGTSYDELKTGVQHSWELDFHFDMFTMGDKYDIEKLRVEAVSQWSAKMWQARYDVYSPLAVQKICGPLAVQFADRSLERRAIQFCKERLDVCFENSFFREMLHEGSLLDARFAGPLFAHAAEALIKSRKENKEMQQRALQEHRVANKIKKVYG